MQGNENSENTQKNINMICATDTSIHISFSTDQNRHSSTITRSLNRPHKQEFARRCHICLKVTLLTVLYE